MPLNEQSKISGILEEAAYGQDDITIYPVTDIVYSDDSVDNDDGSEDEYEIHGHEIVYNEPGPVVRDYLNDPDDEDLSE